MSYDSPRFQLPNVTPAIKALLIANVAVFVVNALLLGRLSDPSDGAGGFWFAFSWGRLFEGYGLGCLRVLSYQFTHSFRDPMHLAMNMLVLFFFGSMAERRLGYLGALRLYLWGGVIGALMHLAFATLQGEADVPLVGASGACYAFLVYATCMTPRATVILVVFPVPLWTLAALLVSVGAYSTFVELTTGFSGGVSHGAHLGGALLGAVAFWGGWFGNYEQGGFARRSPGLFVHLTRASLARWRAQRLVGRVSADTKRQEQLDQVLAKVKSQGLAALSRDERRVLARMSERARRGR